LALGVGAAALSACHKTQPQQNQAIDIEDNVAASGIPPGADIETLPADESSTTPSNQLQNGFDNPDLNSIGNGH
jgi:hypothetical protein